MRNCSNPETDVLPATSPSTFPIQPRQPSQDRTRPRTKHRFCEIVRRLRQTLLSIQKNRTFPRNRYTRPKSPNLLHTGLALAAMLMSTTPVRTLRSGIGPSELQPLTPICGRRMKKAARQGPLKAPSFPHRAALVSIVVPFPGVIRSRHSLQRPFPPSDS